MTFGNERQTVQNPLIKYAVEAGWTYLPPDEALRLRRGDSGIVLHDTLLNQLQRLNPGVVDNLRAEDMIHQLTTVRPNIEGNFEVWKYLKGLKTLFVDTEKRERNVKFLDSENLEANVFYVTDELRFTGGLRPIRADVVFFINGIPVIVVETKAATHIEGIAEALDQIRRYHNEGPELLAVLQLYALTHLIQFYYGATWNTSRKNLYNWREEQDGDFETLVKTFITPRRVLRVLTDFIMFTRKDEELSKVVLRPHQMRAVERVIQRARDPKKRRGLVWHTQGSGKTYTMITVAKRLVEDSCFANPTVLMIVDRNELEQQLFGNLEAVGFGSVQIAKSKRHLIELLRSDYRGLIVSMIHKFEGIPPNVNTRENFFVLIDEAHRSTGGKLGNYLMGALPNATYIGFTGTPIDKTAHGKGTFKVFGTDDPKGYLDKYSIKESIEDGTTVPLHYSLAPNELQVDKEMLEKEFLNLKEIEGVSDIEELNKVLDKAVTLKKMLKSPERVEKIAKFVAEHFQEIVEPMGYKAFLVAVDREACVFYKKVLDRYLPPEYSEVVISGRPNDPEELAKYHRTEEEEEQIRKSFRNPDALPKILIVTEKLLTGFDAPILYCMYLDKPMRDHVLLQAIARVNRPYDDDKGRRKPAGFVLDFVGIFDNLERALAFDSEDVRGVIEGIDILKERFAALIEEGRKNYLPLVEGKDADKAAEAVLEYFRDSRDREIRQEFYQYFQELQDIYEILSPDPFLRSYIKDYEELTRIFFMLRANYEPGISIDHDFLRKTARLVQEKTQTGAIQQPTNLYKIDAETLEKIAKEDKPDTVKVFNLLKAIREIVNVGNQRFLYLIPIGERAEQIAKAFKERQITTQETLKQLEMLVQEFNEAEKERKESDLSTEEFAIYWFLKREGIANAKNIAQQAANAFTQYPHWQTSKDQELNLRRQLIKVLLNSGVQQVLNFTERIMKMLERRFN